MRAYLKFVILGTGMLALAGCTSPFSKGLDVCQEDTCFFDLARTASERGAQEQAREFCAAIRDMKVREECVGAISPANKNTY